MTALIKSTDGSGWVEARVGDKVETCNSPDRLLMIDEILEHSFDCRDTDTLHRILVVHEDCRLIERPFMVGDEVESTEDTFKGVINLIVDGEYRVKPKTLSASRMCYAFEIRHSSPLLRPVGDV